MLSEILNIITITVTVITLLKLTGHIYFHRILQEEIKKAQREINIAREGKAELYSAMQFNRAKANLSGARQCLLELKYHRGITFAKKACNTAREAVSTVEENKRKYEKEYLLQLLERPYFREKI